MSSPLLQPRPVWSIRLILIGLVAITASLPMAWISLAKVLLFVSSGVYLIAGHYNKRADTAFDRLWTAPVVLAILIAFSLSLLWTDASLETGLLAFVKHGKLLEILLLVSLIRTVHEARIGMTAFAIGQIFLLLSSWLLVMGIPLPWVTAHGMGSEYVVFSSYLDQSIIFATTAAIFWHLRSDHLWRRWLGGLLAAAALINVLLLLEARTGYAVALTILSLSVMWAMPKRLRFAALISTPILVLFALYLGSPQVHDRLSKIIHESQTYATQDEIDDARGLGENSSELRLNAWRRSVQAIEENPWLGHGVGSWTMAVERLEGLSGAMILGPVKIRNPHQEYLLWGVELGAGGTLLLLLLILCLVRDARQFDPPIARATLSVVAAMAVACLFNSALYDGLIGDFFCVTLGLLMALGLRTSSSRSDKAAPAPELVQLKVVT